MPTNTAVVFTFTNMVYATFGNAASDLAAVKFIFGGATSTPVAFDNTARTVSYLITVDGGKEYSISQTNFDWPAFQQVFQPPTNYWCGFFDGECGWSASTTTQQVHYLSFAGFHNDLIEVVAKKQGTAQAPDDGLLLKTGDTLEIALKPENILTNSSIAWQTRQLQSNGSFTSWTSYGSGVQLDTVTTQGGIFQLKAVVTAGTDQHEYTYVRKHDEPFATDSKGRYNESYREGQTNYVGVADTDVQMLTRYSAHINLGNINYAQSAILVVYPGLNFTNGQDKCNAFVYHKANDAGATVPLTRGRDRYPPWGHIYPPTAYDWWDASYQISGWTRLADDALPQPGYVVSRPSHRVLPGGDSVGKRWGHVGILDYDGAWIQAGERDVNKYPHGTLPSSEAGDPVPDFQPMGMRKYTGY